MRVQRASAAKTLAYTEWKCEALAERVIGIAASIEQIPGRKKKEKVLSKDSGDGSPGWENTLLGIRHQHGPRVCLKQDILCGCAGAPTSVPIYSGHKPET